MNTLEDLEQRGLIAQTTDRTLLHRHLEGSVTVYAGFDPTADSLHVGHLLPLRTLFRFAKQGHKAIALIGGMTARIGDPSGKKNERVLLNEDDVDTNAARIEAQIRSLAALNGVEIQVVNNLAWGVMTLPHFLRSIGKHFSMGSLLARESTKSRLDSGLSFTEFTYSLLQAIDFLHLAKNVNCRLQIGGSDQWGNLTAGLELIRKKTDLQAHGITLPLLTKADGTKFGKTESGAVWLRGTATSPFAFFQFWQKTDDAAVPALLLKLTDLQQSDIQPGRQGQLQLAREMTSLVHGTEAAAKAQAAAEALQNGQLRGLDRESLSWIAAEVGRVEGPFVGRTIIDAAVASGLLASKGAARREISGGGLKLNGDKVTEDRALVAEDFLESGVAFMRHGKSRVVAIGTGPT